MYEVQFAEGVAQDLASLTAYRRRMILDRIDEQLKYQPTVETKAKKVVVGLKPPWQQEGPVWQLRVREYRVFYDVDQQNKLVIVRAIRRQPPHTTTEEIV